jgi:hypothetical protein
MSVINDTKLVIILCLTLGLAPFFPEPHVWGKIKWLAGGAEGMQLMDWGDLLMHGFPFILALRLIIVKSRAKKKSPL